MKKAPDKKTGKFSNKRTHFYIKKAIKSKFKVKITSTEITNIWKQYIQEEIINPLSVGSIVNLKYSKMWVKAIPLKEHKGAFSLLKNGLMYKGGRLVEASINYDTSKYIYKVIYENSKYTLDKILYYKPHKSISKAVNEGIVKGKLITRFNS